PPPPPVRPAPKPAPGTEGPLLRLRPSDTRSPSSSRPPGKTLVDLGEEPARKHQGCHLLTSSKSISYISLHATTTGITPDVPTAQRGTLPRLRPPAKPGPSKPRATSAPRHHPGEPPRRPPDPRTRRGSPARPSASYRPRSDH